MAVSEKKIAECMKILDISREDAIEMLKEDEAIDRMTSAKQINSDLNAEQIKNAKGMRQADRKHTVFKFDTSKRKRQENTGKRFLIDTIKQALIDEADCNDINVTNVEREIVFTYEGTKYKIVLSAPRS